MRLRNFGSFVSLSRGKAPLLGLVSTPLSVSLTSLPPEDVRGKGQVIIISQYLYCHIYATHPALSLVSIYTLLGPSAYLRLETAPVFKN